MDQADQPVSMKVKFSHRLDFQTTFEFEVEYVVSTADEAHDRGGQMNRLVTAFNEGYAAASA